MQQNKNSEKPLFSARNDQGSIINVKTERYNAGNFTQSYIHGRKGIYIEDQGPYIMVNSERVYDMSQSKKGSKFHPKSNTRRVQQSRRIKNNRQPQRALNKVIKDSQQFYVRK